ncbi:MAG: S8 family serine peptidase [Bacteroidia bacterium]
MRAVLLLLLLCTFAANGWAQPIQSLYWVKLKDKGHAEYDLTKPETFLSPKAIKRRIKQNIPISSSDLPVNTAYIEAVKTLHIEIKKTSKWFNSILISCDSIQLKSLKQLSFVTDIVELQVNSKTNNNFNKFEISKAENLNIKINQLKHTSIPTIDYGYSLGQNSQINVNCLHQQGFMGQGITIAVLDAGFYNTNGLNIFDSLFINNQLLGTRDIVTGDTMVFEDFPHGMNVLSCMAANKPGEMIGTAPKANYWLIRTEDAASETLIEEIYWTIGAEFADSVGVDIINSSLGYNYFDNGTDSHTYQEMDGNTTIITKAADIAASKGILVVSSAGNYGAGPWYKITAPADADSILTVGAIDSLGVIAALSSRGPTYDGRIKPNVVARGLNAVIAGNGGGVTYSSGTSFSAPIVAGAVACLWQAHPNSTNIELIEAIQESASMHNNPDTVMGYGIPNFCNATNILTSIANKEKKEYTINIFPTPFENKLTIAVHSSTKQELMISLTDILGNEVIKPLKNVVAIGENKITIEQLTHLQSGVYILQINDSEKNYFQKIIKQ